MLFFLISQTWWLDLVTGGNLSIFPTETCSVNSCMDANISPQIPTSAGFMQTSKLISLPFLFLTDRSNTQSYDPTGEKSKALFLLTECWRCVQMGFIFLLHFAKRCMCFHCVFSTEKPMTGMNLKNNFGSSEKQVCLPVSANRNTHESANVHEVTEAKHSGGNVASCFSDTLKWTQTQMLACDVSLFSFFLSASLSLSFSTLTAESTSRAKLESSCQSKHCFYEIIVHIMTMSMMHCTFLI